MDKETSRVDLKAENLNVYIRQPQAKFRVDWIYLFPDPVCDLIDALPNAARATLLDAIVLGHTTGKGLITVPVPALLAWGMSRTRRYDSLNALEAKGLVSNKEKGRIYINPTLAYKGRVENYSRAVEAWLKLGGE